MTAEPRAWEGVLAHIEARLVDGRLRPGDHLPAERALSADLGVSRSSVREAIRVLEAMGLVRTQTGSGPTSGAIIVARPVGGMQAFMRLQVAASGFPVADVVRTRLLLETAVAEELAERPSTVDLSDARQLLDAMDDPALTPQEFLALDAQFHLVLAEASGNAVVAATMAGLRTSIEGYVIAGLARIPDWEAMAARLRAEHREVIAAIAAGDAAAARTRIHAHISGYYRDASPEPLDDSSTRTPSARTPSAHESR
ncbi:FadR/GntR family transcriptional regulator [Leifsonia aquatica]|uniref:FCD domain protein n=2 Tax=Leifsonia aquatica TaxID=144185 RepID=U2TAC1_LEIAQ|nr:FCD domain-containing protein [Leifsonia aquatica]ERK71662.1 FCD domain protein [Leifsonia aquatica ATCC 14665]MBB2967175.1 DNA-binding FadR family transcriptional regulator [Leifsonia aquatica]